MDLYANPNYKVCFDSSLHEDCEDLIYYISRGKLDRVIELAATLLVPLDREIRPTGDTIMHACAELGQLHIF